MQFRQIFIYILPFLLSVNSWAWLDGLQTENLESQLLVEIASADLLPKEITVANAQLDGDKLKAVSNSRYWQLLLRYRKTLLGSFKSEVDGKDFFFSPKGSTDPHSELLATILAFSKDIKVGRLQQHPQCAFPERLHFLKKELGLKIAAVKCEKLDEFLERFNPASATFVFSSAYPNNPGSMFGHTFLRINAKPDKSGKKLDMLDHGLSFAAMVGEDENPFAFAVLGLAGGYNGQFSLLPYYVKINEYSNSESRDLWEYDLNINEEETLRLLRNVWEIETNSFFHYFFFDENCAYQLLRLLEVAKPEWGTISNYFIHMIPGESVKRLTEIPGAVTNIKFRPALFKRLLQRVEALSAADREQFFALSNGKKEINEQTPPAVLDAYISELFYRKQKQKGVLLPAQAERLSAANSLRAKMKNIPEQILPEISGDSRPDLGHHAYRIGAAYGIDNRSAQSRAVFQDLTMKFAYHDLLNKDLGYTKFSHFDFPYFNLRYFSQSKDFLLERLTLLSITSLFPWNYLAKPLSWRFDLHYGLASDFCRDCHVAHVEGGIGITQFAFSDSAIFYSLLLWHTDLGRELPKGMRFGPKLQLATLFSVWENWKQSLSTNAVYDIARGSRDRLRYEFSWQHSWAFSRSWESRLQGQFFYTPKNPNQRNSILSAGMNYYW